MFLDSMNSMTLLFVALCIFAIAYRFYGMFIGKYVLKLDDNRETPAIKYENDMDYVPTNRNLLFGHHFAAISAAGPLLGPVLAAQFGFLPGALWIIIGCVLGGGVHDMITLLASIHHKGESIAKIAIKEINPRAGGVTTIAILFILVLTLAGLCLACVSSLNHAPFSLYTVLITMPVAILMGLIIKKRGNIVLSSIVGISLLFIGIVLGNHVLEIDLLRNFLNWDAGTVTIAIMIYGFIASVLPVWLLLVPRDYLSTYLKIGTIALLAIGIIFVHPDLLMPAVTPFIKGGGPVISGSVIPFIFITIACGAISGFHSIVASGTTSKMLKKETDVVFVGYGAMIVEGFVAIMALIAATTLMPGDYFAINTPINLYPDFIAANPTLAPVDLEYFTNIIGINLQGRTGGAVSLAVGMAHIFNKLPFMDQLIQYWYNFAIMFEAVFILSAVDAGTRVGRFFLDEIFGYTSNKFKSGKWIPGIIITSGIFTLSWGYLAYTGNISSIWPLFGICNQLLAGCGLIIGTTMLFRLNKGKYVLLTAIPGVFISSMTFWAGYEQVIMSYLPEGNYLLATLTIIAMLLMIFVFIEAFRKWIRYIKTKNIKIDEYGEEVKEIVME
ncbi:MAG: carbon starvation protein A [Methanobrevibacter sp.]|jgi:carbon starvation protein|nr:carbon starvation protein A [Methanobrevibacter sp.]